MLPRKVQHGTTTCLIVNLALAQFALLCGGHLSLKFLLLPPSLSLFSSFQTLFSMFFLLITDGEVGWWYNQQLQKTVEHRIDLKGGRLSGGDFCSSLE